MNIKGSRSGLPFEWRRPASIAAIAAAHLFVIIWLLTDNRPFLTSKPTMIQYVAISKLPDQKPKVRTVHPNNLVDLKRPTKDILLSNPTFPVMTERSKPGNQVAAPIDSGCAVAEMVGATISEDPAALAQLGSVPANLRTNADVIFAWNGKWLLPFSEAAMTESTTTPVLASETHSPLQIAVERALYLASPSCRAVPMRGPAFIAVRETNRTTMLVIGSGMWRWSQIIAADCVGSAVEYCNDEQESDLISPESKIYPKM